MFMLLYRRLRLWEQTMNAIQPSRVILALLAMILPLAGTGCIAAAVAGTAAAGGIGYAYYKGLLERHYVGPVEPVYRATKTALESLKLPISHEHMEGSKAHLESRTSDGGRIRLWLDPVAGRIPTEPVLTRVSIRIDTFGDRETSRLIFDAIDKQVGPSGVPPQERIVPATPAIVVPASPVSGATGTQPQPPVTGQPGKLVPVPASEPGRLVPVPMGS